MFQRNEGFDATLTAPAPPALAEALGRAEKAANLRCRNARVRVGPEGRDDFCRALAETAEGSWQWLGGADGVSRDGPCSAVAAAWWTDRLGRRHVRIKGARWSFDPGPEAPGNVLCPSEEPRPPLWMIYPEDVYLADAGAGRRVLVACPCGEAGTPQEVGWMGRRYGLPRPA